MAIRSWLRGNKPHFLRCGPPILLSAAIPLVIYLLVMLYHGVGMSKATFLFDFCFLGYLSAFLGLFQKKRYLAVVPFAMVTTTLVLAAVHKYLMLDTWVRFSDLSLLDEAWGVLSLAVRITIVLVVAVAVGITLYNGRRPRYRSLLVFVVPLVLAASLMTYAPTFVLRSFRSTTNAVFGNDPLYRSVFFAIAYDYVEQGAFKQEAATMLVRYGAQQPSVFASDVITDKRNVHIFVLESFMDPLLLEIPMPEDPIDARIRQSLGGYSLSPVFGGRTAQAEFEVLCGTPVYDYLDPVTFNDLRGAPIASLPTLLRKNGYITISSTDVSGTFFNMREAYQSLGFSRSYFRDAFPTKDMDGMWVSADEHIAFNKKIISPLLESQQPFLNYVLFVTGHTPYDMNPSKRPQVLRTTSTEEVTRFVNAVYYNSKSLADYLGFLTKHDPRALIFVTGDHQGALASINRRSNWSHQFEIQRYRVPYLFLDAGKARRYGDIAHFEAAHMIVQSLQGTGYSPMAKRYGLDWIRPFGQKTFYKYQGAMHVCPDADDPRCAVVAEFRKDTVARWLRLIQQSRPKRK